MVSSLRGLWVGLVCVACAADAPPQAVSPSGAAPAAVDSHPSQHDPSRHDPSQHDPTGEKDTHAGQGPSARHPTSAANPPVEDPSEQASEIQDPSTTDPAAAASGEAGAGQPHLPRGTTVLHVGDSFAGALGPELNLQFSAHGVRGILKQEKATYIPTWASRKELDVYLTQYKPDLVLVTLGANELGIVRPEERGETVERLVRRFGDIPCVWIGIPLWKGANPTLLEVIRAHAAPCLYLDSTALVGDLERAKDKIHPSLAGRKVWATAVVRWLAEHRVATAERPWALR
jgi:lysophospholipase L1-like esterase